MPEENTPEEVPAQEPAVTPDTGGGEEPWSLKQDDFNTVVQGVNYLIQQDQLRNQQSQQYYEPENDDLEGMDAAQIVEHYVNARMSELDPYIATAAKDAGVKRMNEIFDEVEPEVGKFDRKVAGMIAESLFGEIGDPVESVRQAARLVAELQKSSGEARVGEYKEALKRSTFQDPGVTGSGERAAPPAKSYDEVIARWSGQEDV